MTIINGYATLTDFRRYITSPGQVLNEDAADDDVIEYLIETASRRVDDLTGRVFYPFIETRSYDVPSDDTLWFDADLLAVTTLTNGDDDAISSSDYVLKPNNAYPKYCLQLRDISSEIWESDSTTQSSQQVIDLLAWWGYHEDYATRAWKSVGTLGAAWASTSTLTATLTAGHTMEALGGQIIKIDTEIMHTSTTLSTTLNVDARGANGSTAATHLINSVVYAWQPMKPIRQLTLEIAKMMYHDRYHGNVETNITKESLPPWAQEVIDSKGRKVLNS